MDSRSRLFDPFQKLLDAFTRDQHGLYAGDAEALHRTRVASRRLRELVPVVGLDGNTSRKVNRRLKKVTRQLGRVRELDVLIVMTDELGGDPRHSSAVLARVRATLEEERAAARDRLGVKLPLTKMERLSHRLRRAISESGSAEERAERRRAHHLFHSGVWAIDARVTHRANRVRVALEAVGGVYVPERLHDVRIALKKLRYALELRTQTKARRVSRTIAVLRTAQDLLGRLHDLEVLIQRTRQIQAASPPLLHAWRELDGLVRALEDDCRILHARYMAGRSKLVAIANRLASRGGDAGLDRRAAS